MEPIAVPKNEEENGDNEDDQADDDGDDDIHIGVTAALLHVHGCAGVEELEGEIVEGCVTEGGGLVADGASEVAGTDADGRVPGIAGGTCLKNRAINQSINQSIDR